MTELAAAVSILLGVLGVCCILEGLYQITKPAPKVRVDDTDSQLATPED